MSTANLNVWITRFGDPCHIEDRENWFVHVLDCEGRVVEWCNRRYSFIPAKCGHVQIEIPPGCYAVFAGHSPQGQGVPPFGNRLTHVHVVRANCGDHVCVTLFSPTIWFCGTWFAYAVLTQLAGLEKAKVDTKTARAAVEGVQALLGKMGGDPFTENMRRALEQEPKE
jgi:hypothetical protein